MIKSRTSASFSAADIIFIRGMFSNLHKCTKAKSAESQSDSPNLPKYSDIAYDWDSADFAFSIDSNIAYDWDSADFAFL